MSKKERIMKLFLESSRLGFYSSSVSVITLQDLANRLLRATAGNFKMACERQEDQRNLIRESKRLGRKFPEVVITDMYNKLGHFDLQAKEWKDRFWPQHAMVKKLGFRVWLEYKAYLMLVDEKSEAA